MKEKNKNEELKSILSDIKKALELYNDLNPEEKMKLVPQEEKKDVSDIFVCVYNDKYVGLFKKINWSTEVKTYIGYSKPEYKAGSIYIGIDSNYIGMKETHYSSRCTNVWERIGTKYVIDGNSYVANCNMQNGMSFDDMRLIMYNDGVIDSYEIGKASSKKMIEVLSYACSYYQLDQGIKKNKTK